ncbi:MAG: class II fructose-bisphosphate aldolase family protein [Candidatus Vogelbacteria bacterium]|nr:class II fructose-bisphosphate aldolase family protein [Candidatus Vogelbacteria bacterium]
MTLRGVIKKAEVTKTAVGHFNISTIDQLWAIFRAAKSLNVPVIIGVSEGERDFIGVTQAVLLVKSIREEFNYPIFINADHTYSLERVKEAIDLGFDSVIFDGAKLSFEENIKITKQCVDYAHTVGKREERDILIEGELGYIGSSSKILDEIPIGAAVGEAKLTTLEDAKGFVAETGIDLFSPAIGSIHGALKSTHDPDLNIQRLLEIKSVLNLPLVLHGGSGLTDENFTKGIDAGLSVVHINTEIRIAWRDALKQSLLEGDPNEVAPYKILKKSSQATEDAVRSRLKLFNKII